MTQKELTNVFKNIVKKCDMLINNDHYEADAYTQDTVEDIAELCNHILDGDYGKLVEVKEVDLEREIDNWICDNAITHEDCSVTDVISTAKHFFELGIQQSKNDNNNEEKK